MKKLIVAATLFAFATFAVPAHAETVTTCHSVYGSGQVCGETTTTVVTETHEVVEAGASDSQMLKLLLSIAGAAIVATGLYKLTYNSYILG